jgi:hypothetical protein
MVKATFSEAMKKASFEVPGAVTLKTSSGGVAVAATVTYNAATKKVLIDPNARLARNTVHTAKITTAATDRAGNKLDQNSTTAGNQAKTWKFTTAKKCQGGHQPSVAGPLEGREQCPRPSFLPLCTVLRESPILRSWTSALPRSRQLERLRPWRRGRLRSAGGFRP